MVIGHKDISAHSATDQLHGHRHREAYVALVLDGGYQELSADGAWSVVPGDVVVHPQYHFHANCFQGKTSVLNLRVPDALADRKVFRQYAVLRSPACADLLKFAGDVHVMQEILSTAEPAAATEPTNWIDSMARDLAAESGVRISDLAHRYSVTIEHASRRFRQRYLMPPSTIRSEQRFRRALELLRSTQHSLSEIAHMAGYADQPHFSRHSLQITGLSPGKLRRKFG